MSEALEQAIDALKRGDLSAAEAQCRHHLSTAPEDLEGGFLLGAVLLQRERYAQALQILDEHCRRHPGHAESLVNLSIAQRKQGRAEDAAATAERAGKLKPGLLSAWNARGLALLDADRPEAAEAVLREGLARHPHASALLLHLAHAIRAQGRNAEAERVYADFSERNNPAGDHAQWLLLAGRPAHAVSWFERAIAAKPDIAANHSGLGRALLRLGRGEEAAAALQRALALDPGDADSRHFLAAARGQSPERADDAYVQRLFDGFAERFEESLVRRLGYATPQALARLIDDTGAAARTVLDLGCGTGLMAEQLKAGGRLIDGVDLSQKMLDIARGKQLYRRLVRAEIDAYLAGTSDVWELIVAADVFVYVGRLDSVLRHATARLAPHGWLVYSVESLAGPASSFRLDPATGRYQHSQAYLKQLMSALGYRDTRMLEAELRHEGKQPVRGLLVAAQRPHR